MPNACFGRLTMNASDERCKEILDYLHGYDDGEETNFDFNNVIPMPENIYDGDLGVQEREMYGKNNWYDWSCENWGTKWNAYNTDICENSISFCTAWSPCSPVIKALSKLFPDAEFDYWYEESGWGFCGHEIYRNGIETYHMEGDFVEEFYEEDEDEDMLPPPDYSEGYHKEDITVKEAVPGFKAGTFESREDIDMCRRLIKGEYYDFRNVPIEAIEEYMEKEGSLR